jgi:hypothetical protein
VIKKRNGPDDRTSPGRLLPGRSQSFPKSKDAWTGSVPRLSCSKHFNKQLADQRATAH